jgi:xanthine dehydrogenase molybdopterin-binding subunit B
MICNVCGEALPEPAPTGQRLVRKCKRHYVEVNVLVLVVHKDSRPGHFQVQRARVTAVQGGGFNYKLDIGFDDPFFVGMCWFKDEGTWWSRTLDDEAAGALSAANALAS